MTGDDRDRNGDGMPRTVHDAMFKTVFSDPTLAAQELRAVLPPALVACVDWSVMTRSRPASSMPSFASTPVTWCSWVVSRRR